MPGRIRLSSFWHWLDSLYFCAITPATVGYGDFSPQMDLGKLFMMVNIFIGIGLLIAAFTRLVDALLAAQRDQLGSCHEEKSTE